MGELDSASTRSRKARPAASRSRSGSEMRRGSGRRKDHSPLGQMRHAPRCPSGSANPNPPISLAPAARRKAKGLLHVAAAEFVGRGIQHPCGGAPRSGGMASLDADGVPSATSRRPACNWVGVEAIVRQQRKDDGQAFTPGTLIAPSARRLAAGLRWPRRTVSCGPTDEEPSRPIRRCASAHRAEAQLA
jgi:hypothetical protein